MAILVDVSDVDLDGRMVFGGDETVGGSTMKVSEIENGLPFAWDINVDYFSLILSKQVSQHQRSRL
jgi:hypothetical protein